MTNARGLPPSLRGRRGLTQAEQRQDPRGRESLHPSLSVQLAECGATEGSQEPVAELKPGLNQGQSRCVSVLPGK